MESAGKFSVGPILRGREVVVIRRDGTFEVAPDMTPEEAVKTLHLLLPQAAAWYRDAQKGSSTT